MMSTLYYIMRYTEFSYSEHLTRWVARPLSKKSHLLKPYGIVGHAAAASLQGTCGSALQRRPLCLASTCMLNNLST